MSNQISWIHVTAKRLRNKSKLFFSSMLLFFSASVALLYQIKRLWLEQDVKKLMPMIQTEQHLWLDWGSKVTRKWLLWDSNLISSSSIQFWNGFFSVNGVGPTSYGHWRYHASPFRSITCILFPSPIFFILFSTCFFHVCFSRTLSLLPYTSNFKVITITFSSSLLKTRPYQRI